MTVITGSSSCHSPHIDILHFGNPKFFLLMHRSGGFFCWAASISHRVDLTIVSIHNQYVFLIHLIKSNIKLCTLLIHSDGFFTGSPYCTFLLRYDVICLLGGYVKK